MGVGNFDDFWRRLAERRLDAREEMPAEAILARLLNVHRSCIVCNLLWERTFDRMARWQYVLAQDPVGLGEFVEHQTWCNRHAWFFKEMADPRTVGRLYRGLLSRLTERIGKLLGGKAGLLGGEDAARIHRDLAGDRRCPHCEDEEAFRHALIATLAEGLTAGLLRPTFAGSGGCCLPHAAALLAAVRGEDAVRFVLEATLAQIKRLAAELDTYEAETESRRRRYGSAADAPVRGLILWSGARGMAHGFESGQGPSPVSPGMDCHGNDTGSSDDRHEPGTAVRPHLGG